MAFASGSYGAVAVGASIAAGSQFVLNHALGQTPWVPYPMKTAQDGAQGSFQTGGLVLVSRTTSFISLLNFGITTWVGDIYASIIWSKIQ